MTFGAIGAIQGINYGAMPGLNASAQAGSVSPGRISELLGATNSMGELIGALNASNLPPGTKIAISDAAQALFSGSRNQDVASFGELAQALIIALILQMLAPGN